MDRNGIPASPQRDGRVDLVRGFALLCIFVDHVPGNRLGDFTLRNFAFSDAAELFVLLAGYSAMLAYGRSFARDGIAGGLRRVALRCLQLYAFQAGLLLWTMLIVMVWADHYGLEPLSIGPLLDPAGVARGLMLRALPASLDILPLYIVLLAAFPVLYLGLRHSRAGLLAASLLLWWAAGRWQINLPNVVDPDAPEIWFLNPLTWQLVFVAGMLLADRMARHGGALPRPRPLAWLAWAFLALGLVTMAPWQAWGLSSWRPLPDPDLAGAAKTWVPPLRLLSVLAMSYLALTSVRLRAAAAHPLLRPVLVCGRHSLAVFAAGTLLSLLGRLAFRTVGTGTGMQLLVNGLGLLAMVGLALWRDSRVPARRPAGAAAHLKTI
ncbi:OpgC domain-containing protein [Roseomonas sp. NAR14]|uniref:OpgC domain-containing protein n=1 Tax=Roseomonas acroporae TaxID=2937791 RepID=A0A9X1Y5A4_9PROT|nr:OpgC domain-containing protein [Roseomonas acroporae]MCK8783563.1 OpgC domain-containing protein [Roseomonas acroporae]